MSEESSSTDVTSDAREKHSSLTSYAKFVSIIILTVGIFLFSQISVILATSLYARIAGLSNEEREAIFSDTSYLPKLLVFAAITGVMVWLVLLVTRAIWFPHEKRRQQWAKVLEFLALGKPRLTVGQGVEIFGTYGVYFFATIIVSIFVNAFGLVDTSQPQDLGIAQPSTIYELAAIFVMLVILPSFGEEIVFRGFLFRALSRYGSVIISTIVTSVLFGFAHAGFGSGAGIVWSAVIDTMVFSVFLIYIMRRHGSVYSAMILHAIKNGIAFTILFGIHWL